MRTLLAAACAATALVQPATATSALTMECMFTYGAGFPSGDASAACTASGVYENEVVSGTFFFTFQHESYCPTQSGDAGWFGWSRVGTTGPVWVDGRLAGVIMFSAPCPTEGETAVISLTSP